MSRWPTRGLRTLGHWRLSADVFAAIELVVAGRSNPDIASTLIVSVRTVESNLTRAYRK